MQAISDRIKAAHDLELLKSDMVAQIWADGEITLQRGGDLLWKRTLHLDRDPIPGFNMVMPVAYNTSSYAVVDYVEALFIYADIVAAVNELASNPARP